MQEYVRKAMRLKKPGALSIQLRAEVLDFFCAESDKVKCGASVLIRGVLEDFYDKHRAAPTEEVSGDA